MDHAGTYYLSSSFIDLYIFFIAKIVRAFSAVEQMESDIMRVHGKYLQLSTQQVTECDEGDSGCAGGWPDRFIANKYLRQPIIVYIHFSAYMYIAAVAEGIEQEDDYPYDCAASFVDECTADKSKNVASLTWYFALLTFLVKSIK